jgi:hypothetical protein
MIKFKQLAYLGLGASLTSLLGIGAMVNPPSLVSADSVVVYEHVDFGGRHESYYNSTPDLRNSDMNDLISSIKVRGGTWKFCENVNYEGRCETLETGEYRQLNNRMNDAISSIQRVSSTSSGNGITFYANDNYDGPSLHLTSNERDLRRRNFNDRARSIKVFSGSWEVCADVDYSGQCRVLTPGDYTIDGPLGSNISSVRQVNN